MGSTPELLPAETFAGYELGEVTGAGLAGQVWNARDVETGADVAVEVIGAPLGADAEFRQRLAAEVDRASVLAHPTIASVYEVLFAGERVGVVTDSLVTERTDALTRVDGLPLAATLFIAEAVLRAMMAAHRAGVVHGAIEPRVIFVEGTRIRIGGFGVGRALRSQVAADPSTDTRAVARLVVDLTAGSAAAARYATLPQQLRVVLARAAAAKRERHYRTAAGMRSALVHAARCDLGDDWRDTATAQLTALSAGPAADAPASVPAAAQEVLGHRSAPAARADPEVTGPSSGDAPVARAALGELAVRRRAPSMGRVLAGLALVALAIVVGVVGGAVASAVRGSSRAAPALSVGRPVSLTVGPAPGSCNSTFVATATGPVQGSGTLLYRWARSDGEQTASTALSVSARDGSFLITQHWQLSGEPSSITFQLLSPVAVSVTRPVHYSCP